MAAADRQMLAEFVRTEFPAILRELDTDLHTMAERGGLGELPDDFHTLLSRPLDALPGVADVIEEEAGLDRHLLKHDLAKEELKAKQRVIRRLWDRVKDARRDLLESLAKGSRKGMAWLRRTWEALLDAVNALVGSAIDAMTAAHLGVGGLQVGKEAKDFGAAIVKIVR